MKSFDGVFTALITPFEHGEVDLDSFRRLVRHQVNAGTQKFVINGTTAESPTLTWSEVVRIFEAARDEVGDEGVLIVGTGSNNTKNTVEATLRARDLGADGALVVCPYYNKPTVEGLRQHFLAAANSSDLPIVLYNVPGRTITKIPSQLIVELSSHKNIVGVKEASGNIARGEGLIKACGKDFIVTSGDDGTCFELASKGGSGVISVMSHILPSETVEWMQRSREGDPSVTGDFEAYRSLVEALYCEPNPIPVKMALYLMNIIKTPDLRLPMVQMSAEGTSLLKQNMQQLELI